MPFFDSIQQFLNTGGEVLWTILWTSICLWCLIVERLLFFKYSYPKHRELWMNQWEGRANKYSKQALFIRDCIISEARISMGKTVPIIKMLIALCPLLGLLGTVTGMIATFQSISLFGTGDPKLMASGISQALVTTMLGLCVAIPLLFLHSLVASRSRMLIQILDEQSAGLISRRSEK